MADVKNTVVAITNSNTTYDFQDCIGGVLLFTDFVVAAGTACNLRSIQLQDDASLCPELSFLFLREAPEGTYTDNAAIVYHANDRDRIVHHEAIFPGDWEDLEGMGLFTRQGINKQIFLVDTSLRVVLVAKRRVLYPAGTGHLSLRVEVDRL